MGHLHFHVAGESHGPAVSLQLTGLPARLPIPVERINHWLALRRGLAGRGPRAPAEQDRWTVLSGASDGLTNGGPLAIRIDNGDQSGRSVDRRGHRARLEFPRPGHADLAGALKWGLVDASPVAELASARITVAYTVLGAICQELLGREGICSLAHVTRIGQVADLRRDWKKGVKTAPLQARLEESPLLFLNRAKEASALRAIEDARKKGDTLGGAFEVVLAPMPAGLGDPQPLGARLDGRLAGVLMGIPGVVAVAIGDGFDAGRQSGRAYHPTLSFSPSKGYYYHRNRAGGIEGGMTNGHPVVVRAIMKPLASLGEPVASVSLADQRSGCAAQVRSDVCAVAPAAIVARSLVAYVLARTLLDDRSGED